MVPYLLIWLMASLIFFTDLMETIGPKYSVDQSLSLAVVILPL